MDLAGAVRSIIAAVGGVDEVSSTDVCDVIGAAVRLYAAAAERRANDLTSIDVNATEAVVAASALLRSQQLTPFEFMIWYDRLQ